MNTRGLMRRRWVALALAAALGLSGGHLVGQAPEPNVYEEDTPPPGAINILEPVGDGKLSPELALLAANAGASAEVMSAEFAPPEVDVIVNFRDKASATLETISLATNALPTRSYASLPFKAMRVPVDQLQTLVADGSVRYVTADSYVVTASKEARQTARVPGSTAALNTPNMAYPGTGIGVAIVDTGVYLHGDYYRNAVWQHDFLNGANGVAVSPSDPYGHGTHVAGMVTGDGYYSTSAMYQGVATRANVISLRALDQQGRGRLSDVLAALDWIVYPGKALYNIRVVNLSFGKGVEEPQACDPLVQAVNAVWDAGVVVVVSAGNFGHSGNYTISSPGNSRKVITVGSLTDAATGTAFGDDFVSTFSSRGPTLFDHVLKPDLIAPGNKVVAPFAPGSKLGQVVPASRVFCGVSGGSCSWRYLRLSGSSMAAAMVSGAVARMLEKTPSLTPATVKARLMKSARKIPGDPTGTGAGVLDVEGAMNASGTLSVNALSPLMGLSASGTTVVYVQDTARLWGSQWSAGTIWRDGYLWSNGGPLSVTGYLWSNGSLWSDSSLWADGSLWSEGFLWSEAVAPASVAIEDPDQVNP